MPCDAAYLKEKCASCLFEASSLSSDAESLARKPAADKVVLWDFGRLNSGNVAGVDFSEVLFVGFGGVLVPLV